MSRIIAGSARGRRLATPPGDRTRPTSDKVKEALFSTLTGWADGVGEDPAEALRTFSFLDLYAGSGGVGLEAASRGADPVWLVEQDRRCCDIIRANALDADLSVAIQQVKAEQFAQRPASVAFDIIWLDPPYEVASDKLDRLVANLLGSGWLASTGLIVQERSTRSVAPSWPEQLGDRWDRRYGETTVYFAQAD